MLADILSVLLRSLSFVGMLQGAGAALFLAIFQRQLSVASLGSIRALARYAALSGAVLVLAQGALEAARMAGELPGVLDLSLQELVLTSSLGVTIALRVVGLLLIGSTVRADNPLSLTVSVIGAALVAFSFAITGHTAVHAQRWLLAPLLMTHVLIVAFWFGALVPLHLASQRESLPVAASLVAAFSRIAGLLVPGIFIAGAGLALVLIPRWGVLLAPYGELLIVKVVGFAALMALAAANKWRFGPAMERGDSSAAPRFRRALAAEIVLIAAVLAVTATMTTWFSPEPVAQLDSGLRSGL